MTEKELLDIVAAHADGLNRDEELSEQLLASYKESAPGVTAAETAVAELAPLLQLASALKEALTPVSAPAFKENLGHALVSYGPPMVVLGRSVSKRKARTWLTVAAAGSLISAAGVTALVLRRVRSVKDVTSRPAAA